MDVKKKMITCLVREFLKEIGVFPFQVGGFGGLMEGVAIAEYNHEIHIFYDRTLWECSHPENKTDIPETPMLKELELGFFPGPIPPEINDTSLKEYCEKFLELIAEAIARRRAEAADANDFE